MMQFGLQNQNQSFINNNLTNNTTNLTNNSSFADNGLSGLFNTGGIHTGSTLTSLGSDFNNSPAVQTFGNIGAGSSFGVTQNINYTQPNSTIGAAPTASPTSGFNVPANPFGGFSQAPVYQPTTYQPTSFQPASYQPTTYQPAQSLPTQYPPQNYYTPQPSYPQAPVNGGFGGIQALIMPLMQMMQMMLSSFMENGSFIGSEFKGDIDYHGDHDHEVDDIDHVDDVDGADDIDDAEDIDEGPFEETIVEEEIIVDGGRVWGDPHFVGAEGGKYDVMGEHGKIYNILSDKGIQFNAQFAEYKGQENATIMSNAGLTLGEDQVAYGIDGKLLINGEEMTEDGSFLEGQVVKTGSTITIKSAEWDLRLENTDNHLNYDFKSGNAAADGVLPHGLFGQSADGDGQARNGDEGKGAQGGGAIETIDGTISEKGDKETYKAYEVTSLFDTEFEQFNKFNHQAAKAEATQEAQAQAEADAETEQAKAQQPQT